MNIKEYLCQLLGCADICQDELFKCENAKALLERRYLKAQDKIRQLELLVPRTPPPALDYIIEKDTAWIQTTLTAVAPTVVRMPLDAKYRLTNEANFGKALEWEMTDGIKYVRDYFDCENFALHFKRDA